jgi:hypothetical protein
MLVLHRYFKEFVKQLEDLKLDSTSQCEIPEFGRVGGLEHSEFSLFTAQPDDISKFTVTYQCESAARPQVLLDEQAAERLRKQLRDARIRYEIRPAAGKVIVTLIPSIPVSFEFASDPDRHLIALRTRNHESLGVLAYQFHPDVVQADFLDEIGKLMIARPSRFKELSGGVIDESTREELRRSLDRGRRERDAEASGPMNKLVGALGEAGRKLLRKS